MVYEKYYSKQNSRMRNNENKAFIVVDVVVLLRTKYLNMFNKIIPFYALEIKLGILYYNN